MKKTVRAALWENLSVIMDDVYLTLGYATWKMTAMIILMKEIAMLPVSVVIHIKVRPLAL